MKVPFEQIQQALGAAIRGEETHPVISQRTLFGIPSSVETQMAKFAAEIAHEQSREPQISNPDIEKLREKLIDAACEIGTRAIIGRGMRYFIVAARNDGFDIPAYPFDPKGEFKDFLKASHVTDLPGWYESIGIPLDQYEQLQTHALLVIQDEQGRKSCHLVKGAEYCDASKFVPLFQSRTISLGNQAILQSIASVLEVSIQEQS